MMTWVISSSILSRFGPCRCSAQALETSILAHYDDLPPKAQISYYFLHPFGAYFPSAEQKEFVDDYARHVSDSA